MQLRGVSKSKFNLQFFAISNFHGKTTTIKISLKCDILSRSYVDSGYQNACI